MRSRNIEVCRIGLSKLSTQEGQRSEALRRIHPKYFRCDRTGISVSVRQMRQEKKRVTLFDVEGFFRDRQFQFALKNEPHFLALMLDKPAR